MILKEEFDIRALEMFWKCISKLLLINEFNSPTWHSAWNFSGCRYYFDIECPWWKMKGISRYVQCTNGGAYFKPLNSQQKQYKSLEVGDRKVMFHCFSHDLPTDRQEKTFKLSICRIIISWGMRHWDIVFLNKFGIFFSAYIKCFYRTQVSLGSGLWVPVSLSMYKSFGWNFADMTLSDDETNSIQLMMPI